MATGAARHEASSGPAARPRPEETGYPRNPEIIIGNSPYEDNSIEYSPRGAVKRILKAEVDEKKILSVTTVYDCRSKHKRMIMADRKTDQGDQSAGSKKVRKPAKAKPGPSGQSSKQDQSPILSGQSAKQTANRKVPKVRSSEKHGTANRDELPKQEEQNQDIAGQDDRNKGEKARKRKDKKTVTIQVIFYRLSDINTLAETFDAELIFNAKWPERAFDTSEKLPDRLLEESEYSWSPELYVENSVKEPNVVKKFLTLRYASSGKALVIESTKLNGTFSEPMQLSNFPFDTQNMSLLIRTEKPSSEVHLTFSLDDPHLIRRSLYFQKQQFRLYMHVVTEDLTKVPYDEYGAVKTADELKVICYAARNPVFYIINCYLIALLLCLLGFVSFSADAKFTMQRNVLSFFLMLGAVSHKYTLIPHIPKTSYMTHADQYCLATIIYLCLLSVWHAMMTLLDPAARNDLDWIGIVIFAGMLLLYNVGSWRVFLTTTYTDRKAMAEEERKYLTRLKVLRKERATIDNALSD